METIRASSRDTQTSVSALIFHFLKLNLIEDRAAQSAKIVEKYPEKIPVICEKDAKSKMTQ